VIPPAPAVTPAGDAASEAAARDEAARDDAAAGSGGVSAQSPPARGDQPTPSVQSAGQAAGQEPAPVDIPGRQVAVRRVPLGRVAGARSGDKGGDANIGVWARTDAQWRWLEPFLTVERFR